MSGAERVPTIPLTVLCVARILNDLDPNEGCVILSSGRGRAREGYPIQSDRPGACLGILVGAPRVRSDDPKAKGIQPRKESDSASKKQAAAKAGKPRND